MVGEKPVAAGGWEIRQVRAAEVSAACAFLSENMRRGIRAEGYRVLFEYPWRGSANGLGYAIYADGEIVGFIGAFHAERRIGERIERFLNVSNWCVLEKYRHASVALLSSMLDCGDVTVTNFSPIPIVERLFRRMRYKTLDTYKLFSPPLIHAWTLLSGYRGLIIVEREKIRAVLGSVETQIFDDHQRTRCGHLVILNSEEKCYVVWNRRLKRGVAFSEILYASDATVLRRHFEAVKLQIMRQDRTFLVAIDERLIGKRLPGMSPYRRVSLFKSARLSSEQIDNLYSEVALL